MGEAETKSIGAAEQKAGQNTLYDVAIIGAGPAGVSAALNLKLHKKSILWFGSMELSNKVEKSEKIANYPGLCEISGEDLNQSFRNQIKKEGLELTDKMVTNIVQNNGQYMLLADNSVYQAKNVLITIGSFTGKGFQNETRFLGNGVSYCATCDGFLYSGKTIAVFCGSKRYEHEVEYLAQLAKEVYLYANYEDCEVSRSNVTVLKSPIKGIEGEERVEQIILVDGTQIPVDGVFVLRTAVAPASMLSGLQLDGPHIAVDRFCRTNLDGVFAAGDCTGRPYQIAKAVGEGNVAAHQIVERLADR